MAKPSTFAFANWLHAYLEIDSVNFGAPEPLITAVKTG